MAGGSTERLQRDLTTLFQAGSAAGLTDGELASRIPRATTDEAEALFEVLVDRHGPMVLRVCRNALGDPHDADDAFQATFLVLVRRADSLWVRDSGGPGSTRSRTEWPRAPDRPRTGGTGTSVGRPSWPARA
jgi:hypothetical protein